LTARRKKAKNERGEVPGKENSETAEKGVAIDQETGRMGNGEAEVFEEREGEESLLQDRGNGNGLDLHER